MALKSNNTPVIPGIFLILFLCLSTGLSAQDFAPADVPAVSKGELQFYVDNSAFKGTKDKAYVEFYLMLFSDQLEAVNNKAEFTVKALITDIYQNEVSSNEWTTEANLENTSGDSLPKVIYDQFNEKLKPGNYNIKISVKDKNGNKKGEVSCKLKVEELSNSELTGSQVEFVSGIGNTSGKDQFKKGTNSIVPNPSRRYGLLNPILYIYYELYGEADSALTVNYSVIGKSGEAVKSFPPVNLIKTGTTIGVTHGFNVSNIQSGIYDLRIQVLDSAKNKSTQLNRRFEVVQMDYADKQTALDPKDEAMFDKLLGIIGNQHQQSIYRQLPLNSKAEFMVQYWKENDPTPGTSENEYLEKIQQRVQYANKNFSWAKNEGWETERGRVLIQYGMPDETERHNMESGVAPYEVWIYRQQKDYIFIFGDIQSNGRYVLLHSTKEGEIYNERWVESVRQL